MYSIALRTVSFSLTVLSLVFLSGCSEELTRANLYKSTDVVVSPNSDIQVGEFVPDPSPSASPNPNGKPGESPAVSPMPSNDPEDDKDDETGDGTDGEEVTPDVSPSPSPFVESDPGSCELDAPAILLLSENGKAFKVSGNGGTMNVGGDVHVNSKNSHAIQINGSGVSIIAKKVSVVGGIKIGPNAKLTADEILKGASAMEDPLADLPAPDCSLLPIRSQKRLRVSSAMSIEPGRYLGGIFIKRGGDVTMQSGVYCLIGGGLRVHRGKLTGERVMIVSTTRVRYQKKAIDMKRGAVVSLSPIQDCGSRYHGITFFQDRSQSRGIRLASGQLSINGLIYAPKSKVDVREQRGGAMHPFTQLIARKLRVHMHLGQAELDQEGEYQRRGRRGRANQEEEQCESDD